MRALGTLFIVCVALAIVKAVVAALLLALLIALIWATCLHPREASGLLTYCAIMGALNTYPSACPVIIGVAMALALVGIGRKTRLKALETSANPKCDT